MNCGRRAVVQAGVGEVAAGAVAGLLVLETLRPRSSAARERAARLLVEVQIVLAVVGMKARVFELERLQRELDLRRRRRRRPAPRRRTPARRPPRRGAAAGRRLGGVGVGHLERREQRRLGLLGQRIGAAVPGEPAAGAGLAEAVGVVEQVGVAGRELLVAKRRDGAQTGRVAPRAAELHRQVVGRAVRVVRIVAGGARHACPRPRGSCRRTAACRPAAAPRAWQSGRDRRRGGARRPGQSGDGAEPRDSGPDRSRRPREQARQQDRAPWHRGRVDVRRSMPDGSDAATASKRRRRRSSQGRRLVRHGTALKSNMSNRSSSAGEFVGTYGLSAVAPGSASCRGCGR